MSDDGKGTGSPRPSGGGGVVSGVSAVSASASASAPLATVDLNENPTAPSPAASQVIIPNPQLHQAIYAYFLSINGTTAGASHPMINTQPILGAMLQTFPTESSNFAALLSPDGRGVGESAAPCARQLVHRYIDHPRLAARVVQLENELKALRGDGYSGPAIARQPTGSTSGSSGNKKKRSRQEQSATSAAAATATGVLATGTEVSAKRSRQALAQPMARPIAAAAAAAAAAAVAAAPATKPSPAALVAAPDSYLLETRKSTKSWSDLFADLKHFRAGYGHCRVPTKHPPNQELSRWVQSMRQAYKAYKLREEATNAQDLVDDDRAGRFELTPSRKQMLEDLGFEWSVKEKAIPWSVRYQELIDYKAKHGNCRVPRTYKANPKLGEWCHQQRGKYRKMHQPISKGSGLDHDKIMKLEEIGFEWVVGGKKQSWDQRFEALVEFRRVNGHVNIFANVDDSIVKGDKSPDEYEANRTDDKAKAPISLVRWASYQRTEYRKMISGHHSRLTKAKIKRLEGIGFDLAGPEELRAKPYVPKPKGPIGARVPWEERLRQLIEYRSEFGHCRVPQGWAPNPSLNMWVNEQRRNYRLKQEGRCNGLDDEKQRKLEEIGFEWRVNLKKPAASGAIRQEQVVGLHDEHDSSDSDEYGDAVERLQPTDNFYI